EGHAHSMVLYGPPGTGKTTIARLVASAARAAFEELSAVEAGRAEVRAVLARAAHRRAATGEATVFFLDEIHRFNKAQQDALQRRAVRYDKAGDQHYDLISAWIKSTRGSDPDASLYYLAVMLEGGEDPRFIARRMIVLASEDVGNADPQALQIAVAAAHAVEHVGMPECVHALAQAAIYLSLAPTSNAAYRPIAAA